MAKKGPKPKAARPQPKGRPGGPRDSDGKSAVVYKHEEEKLLLRPDVGLQAQFRKKKSPKTYRYDSSLDPAMSWDVNGDRERGEALIARIESATTLEEAKAAAGELKRMSRPFLNWAGKAERREFDVPTLPLFIHERLSTQAILQSVKSHKRDRQQTLSLFADEELDVTDRLLKAYEYPTNWVNRLILGDSLIVMNSLLEYEGMGGKVQMIYLDPPYGVSFGSNFQPFLRRNPYTGGSPRQVRHGEDEDFTREPEMVQAYRDVWELGLHSYLSYLRDRLGLCRNLLAASGSVFVQIGDRNVHHVREILDEVFGAENFVVSFVVKKKGGQKGELIDPVNDYLLWYAKDLRQCRGRFHQLFERAELNSELLETFRLVELPDGRELTIKALSDEMGVDYIEKPERLLTDYPGSRLFTSENLTSGGYRRTQSVIYNYEGRPFDPGIAKGNCWKHSAITDDGSPSGMDRLATANRLYVGEKQLRFKRYLSDFGYTAMSNWWDELGGAGRPIYVVQTNSEIVKRCILMTTDPGDLVLDPTCGSGTTAFVAEHWGRRWITIDTSRVPIALARERLLTARYPYFRLRDAARGPIGGFVYLPRQNEFGEQIGGVVPHITSSTIANAEPPREEILVDRAERDAGVVRVTGPFVVEATIPSVVEKDQSSTAESPSDYGDSISRMMGVLRKSPTLRIARDQVIELKNIRRPAKALSIGAEADIADGGAQPVAIVFGPEDGPVTEQLVFAAAREANLKSYARLFVIGFGIQPGASKLIQNAEAMAGIPATYVQATMDLLMGDLLKTTRASQIFSVTGAPDVRLVKLKRKNGNGPLYHVELRGLDVFDPILMQNEHRKGDDVPAWFLDSDYDDLVFRVTQAFFPRTSAWDALKRALKGTYDDAVWEHLAGTVSEPFSTGEHRRVAVKVIDDRGNELMVVVSLDDAEAER